MGFFDFLFGGKKTSIDVNSSAQKSSEKNNVPENSINSSAVRDVIEKACGTDDNPVQVEKQKLQDGSIYTGQARLLTNGYYLPYGYGKKFISPELEMTAHWVNGYANGMCYLNMHDSMVTGHFSNNRPNGWCISVEGGVGFVFGVFQNDDCVLSLGDSMLWLIRSMDLGLKISYKKGQILIGEVVNNQARGFHFMNNGDLYVGTDDSKLSKSGFFFKFTKEGYIQIGLFENGILVEELPGEEVVFANGGDVSFYKPLNTNKKYF